MLTRSIVFVVLALVIIYGFIEAWPLLSGPSLAIASPLNGYTATSSMVTLSGVATRTVALTLDGAPVLPDQSGRFSQVLAFPTGVSILTFTASDRFGRTITKTRTIAVP